MSLAAICADRDGFRGELSLAGPEVLRELLRSADDDGYLSITLATPGPGQRGELALVISEAIDSALEQRGACPPGIGAATDLGSSLSDQLYRARLVELRGLALALPSLEGIANLAGALDAEDSAVLRWWMAATLDRPVRLYLDAGNRYAGVYDRPVPLQDLLERGRRDASGFPPALAPEVNASSEAMELSARPPAVALAEVTNSAATAATTAEFEASVLEASVLEASVLEASVLEASVLEASEPESSHNFAADVLQAIEPPPMPGRESTAADAACDDAGSADSAETQRLEDAELGGDSVGKREDPAAKRERNVAESREHVGAERDVDPVTNHEGAVPQFAHAPLFPNAAKEWRTWLNELEAARGPKPLAVVERMFVTSYVPLCDAVARGIAPAETKRSLETWSASFEQSYKEAFDALRVRGKRPTMVLDVPELALRMGRLHGARSVQLVLVDGLRFDLGLRVEQRLRALLGQSAALTERLLLWSALPATTAVQLELIGRGAEALREFTGQVESEVPVARGRMASTLRRIKAGHRELLKLDVVESAVSEPDECGETARLDVLADETARALGLYMQRLPARTLVMVFGDHGFVLDALGSGTSRARPGGAAPEEVLVPAYAWLVGGVH